MVMIKMTVDLFSRVDPVWLNMPDSDNHTDAVPLLSCVRIRRNIEGFPFPAKCNNSELYDSAAVSLGCIGRSELWNDCDVRMIDNLNNTSKNLLLEMRMITPLHAQGGGGRFF